MKRPSRTVIALLVALLAFVITEVIVCWPETPKPKRQREESENITAASDPPAREPATQPPPPASAPPVPPASQGRTIPQIQIDEKADEIRRLETCRGKRCGDPCVLRCDPSDGQCTPQGIRPGACASDGECNYMMPAICPGD